jgi:hypothetical protein
MCILYKKEKTDHNINIVSANLKKDKSIDKSKFRNHVYTYKKKKKDHDFEIICILTQKKKRIDIVSAN